MPIGLTDGHVIDPAFQNIIFNGPIAKKIERAKGSNFYHDSIYESDLEQCIDDLRQRGFINAIQQTCGESAASFYDGSYDTIVTFFERNPPLMHTPAGQTPLSNGISDNLALFLGLYATDAITKKDLASFQRDPRSVMNGITGLLMNNKEPYSLFTAAHVFQYERNGITLEGAVGADQHGDLRISLADVTPYRTSTALDYDLLARPKDIQLLSPYHSLEVPLMASLVTFMKQVGVGEDLLRDNGSKLHAALAQAPTVAGTAAEPMFDRVNISDFIGTDAKFDRTPTHALLTTEHPYDMTLEDNALVFRHRSDDPKNNYSISWPAQMVPGIVYGLIRQCANGLGRTGAHIMRDALKIRLSQDYDDLLSADSERMHKVFKKYRL